jgi:dipeptidyl aminopeptidase/acylaminoacyl peptidase
MQNDITDGVYWLIRRGIADRKRIAIYGTGFGGYSALHGLCFNPNLYACGVSYSGPVNLFSYVKEIPSYNKPYLKMYYEMIGNPEKDIDYFRSVSPVFHSDRIKAPVFIAQGTKDKKANINDLDQFVKDLRSRNIPVNYMLKEDEGSYFSNRENRVHFYQELEDFLGNCLKTK